MRLLLLFAALVLSGCLGASPTPSPLEPVPLPTAPFPPVTLRFSPPKVLSLEHAGGEPAIVVTPKGTILVASHPGYTHTHGLPPSLGVVTSTTYESYMWRSTDGGESWTYVGLPGLDRGPRGPARGISDPDFAVDGKGRIFFTDLNALVTDSVARSDDDGETWLFGNPAVQVGVDRQWIAAYRESVWIVGNTFLQGQEVKRSDDGGLTWTSVGVAHLGGKITADPRDGTLYIGGGSSIDVSTDGGRTWTVREIPGHNAQGGGHELGQVAVDSAGTIYTAWTEGPRVFVAASKDKGITWLPPVELTSSPPYREGTPLWPWVVAGDEGKAAVVWYHSFENASSAQSVKGGWHVVAAFLLNATSLSPRVVVGNATEKPVHIGPICLRGTSCQLDPFSDASDRRLGDLFEAAVGLDGSLYIAYSDTTSSPQDSVSHPAFVKLLEGPKLRG